VAVIRVEEIARETHAFGRPLGERIGQETRPGDVVDFRGGYGSSNSVVDSFVRVFVAKNGPESLETLGFRYDDELFRLLLTKARHRWSSAPKAEERNRHAGHSEIEWGEFEDLFEGVA